MTRSCVALKNRVVPWALTLGLVLTVAFKAWAGLANPTFDSSVRSGTDIVLAQKTVRSEEQYRHQRLEVSARFDRESLGINYVGFRAVEPVGVYFEFVHGVTSAVTTTDEGMERIILSDQPDLSVPHQFSIEWFEAEARFYVDNMLVSINTESVPDVDLPVTLGSEHQESTLVCGTPRVDELVLHDRSAETEVLFPSGSSVAVRIAAIEFYKYACLMTGQPIEIGHRSSSTAGDVVIVRAVSDLVPDVGIPGERWSLIAADTPKHEDGFLITTFTSADRRYLVVSGRTARAALFGVYHYLEKYCHVGFFKDGESVPRSPLVMENLHAPEAPAFEFRSLGGRSPYLAMRNQQARYNLAHESWLLKKKASAVPLTMFVKQRGIRDMTASGRSLYVGYYPTHDVAAVQEVCPKTILTDGFSSWRGTKYYGVFAMLREVDEAEQASRLVYGETLAAGPPPDSSHIYYFAWPSENPEWVDLTSKMMKASAKLMKQYDPAARFWTETYGPDKFTLFRAPLDLIVFDVSSDDHMLPSRLRTGNRYNSSHRYFGKQWVDSTFLGGMTSGQDQIHRVLPTCRELPRIARNNLRNNCTGLFTFSDYLSTWFYEDLYGDVAWNPQLVTYESWLEDLCRRRYGPDSLENMKKSFALFIDVSNRQRYIGFGRYQYDSEILWGSDDHCWWPTVKKDWFAWTQGNRELHQLRQALELALRESERQKDNRLYDRTIVDIYRIMSSASFKLGIIRMHHHYFRATQLFGADRPDEAQVHAEAFSRRAADLDAILAAMEEVLSTYELYRCASRDGSFRPTAMTKDRFWRGTQNSKLDFFEFVHFVYRPRLAVMVDVMRQRLQRGEKAFVESKEITPFFPGPDPWFYYPTAKDDQTRSATLAILQRFIDEDVYRRGFEGSTAEAARAGLDRLEDIGALDYHDMASIEMIARNYPLSDPPLRPWTHEPVRYSTEGAGAWVGGHHVLEPLFRGPQVIYNGPALGAWYPIENGRCELSFTYRNAMGQARRSDPTSAFIQIGLKVQHPTKGSIIAGGLRFFADPGLAPQAVMGGRTLIEEDVHVGATDRGITSDQDWSTRSDRAEDLGAAHTGKIQLDGGAVRIVVNGNVIAESALPYFDPEGQRVCTAIIESQYPSHGSAPSLWIKGLTINGKAIELYTDHWNPWADRESDG